jgi:hypothetical protein
MESKVYSGSIWNNSVKKKNIGKKFNSIIRKLEYKKGLLFFLIYKVTALVNE